MKIFAFRHGDRRRVGLLDGAVPRDLSSALEAAGVVDSEHDLLRHDFFRPQRLVAFLKRWRRFAPKIEGEIRFDVPVAHPSKILCIGRNFAEHARELGNEVDEEPVFFAKLAESLLPHGAPIVVPPGVGRVDHEAELAIVVARDGRDVPAAKAFSYVAGYTCLNDVTAREQQGADKSKKRPWLRSKSHDSFCPMGPYLVPVDDVTDLGRLRLQGRVNGEVRQSALLGEMVHEIPSVLAFLSRHTTLRAGDVIALGTPAGVGPLRPGDVVEVEVEGIGCLRNPVVAREAAPSPDGAGEKARAFRDLEPRLAEAIETARDGGEALERVVDLLDALPHFHWTGIYRVEPDGSLGLGPYRGRPTEHVRIDVSKGICGRAIRQNATIVVDDVTADAEYLACSLGTRSEIVVPIQVEGRPVAEIDIDSDVPGAFDATDREFLERIAARIGKFLASTRLPRMWDDR